MIVLFINCNLFPFVYWIIKGLKLYETRNRNTLKSIVGKQVYIAETEKNKRPIIHCIALIGNPIVIENIKNFNRYRSQTKIKKGSLFDFIPGRKKYLYSLLNIEKVNPFPLPENAIYHGRIYAITNN